MATLSTHLPQAAANVQARLGLAAKFIQLDSGCSGFVDALMVADSLMGRHPYETAPVIAGDPSSHYLHPRHFMDLSVFGDGAGAVVLRRMHGSEYGLRSFSAGSDTAHVGLPPANREQGGARVRVVVVVKALAERREATR